MSIMIYNFTYIKLIWVGVGMKEKIIKEFYELRDKIIENRYKELNPQQRSAVLSHDRNLAVIACPGAGKTTTLIRRIDYLVTFGPIYKTKYYPDHIVEDDINLLRKSLNSNNIEGERIKYLLGGRGVNPDNIIVITFTRAAAMSMKKKYISINGSNNAPFFGTFHGLFYKILSRRYKQINIIESYTAYRIVKNVLSSYLDEISEEKVKEIINTISFYKTSNISEQDFSPNIDKNIFFECYKAYEEYKEKNNLLDFDDLQIKCKELFLREREVLKGYRRLFKYMLVDEFQDCDSMQIDILKLLNKENSIFVVGDEDQCIYGFRGSKPECMVNFHHDFEEGKKIFLSTNYRCPKSVVNIANNLISNNKMRNQKNMYAYKNSQPKINVLNYPREGSQAEDIALNIIKLVSLGKYEYEDNAIIYRTNVESRSLIDAFIRKKIPFYLLDKEYNFFEHFICKDIISYLKLSIDKKDKESFFRIINKPFRYISKVNLEKLRKNCIGEDCFEILKEIESIPPFQMKTIDKLKRDIQNLNKMSLAGAINFILKDLGYYEYLREYASKYKLDISELEDIVEEFIESSKEYAAIITFLAHVSEVEEQIRSSKKRENKRGVILSTIHGVKGMEFKNVFIINCNEDNIPHISSIDTNLEEERRLFYVGITRSIDNLWLSISNDMKGKNKKPSRFLEECKLNILMKNDYDKGERVIHKAFGKGEIIHIDDKVIEIKFENGINRSFDAVTLYNNGLIKKLI
jgi:DNA helicase II / ATP-dependent DNA helicase PcrA